MYRTWCRVKTLNKEINLSGRNLSKSHSNMYKMEGIKPPTGLDLSGGGANWSRFKQQFQLYLEAVGLSDAKEERKVAVFLNVAGEDAVDVYNSHMKPNEAKTLDNLLKQFDDYVEPRKNIITSSFKFFNLKQEEGEQVDRFIKKWPIE